MTKHIQTKPRIADNRFMVGQAFGAQQAGGSVYGTFQTPDGREVKVLDRRVHETALKAVGKKAPKGKVSPGESSGT